MRSTRRGLVALGTAAALVAVGAAACSTDDASPARGSPVGPFVAAVRFPHPGPSIVVLDAAGRVLRRITATEGDVISGLAGSPDGALLLTYVSRPADPDDRTVLRVIDATGASVWQRADDSAGCASWFDDRRILESVPTETSTAFVTIDVRSGARSSFATVRGSWCATAAGDGRLLAVSAPGGASSDVGYVTSGASEPVVAWTDRCSLVSQSVSPERGTWAGAYNCGATAGIVLGAAGSSEPRRLTVGDERSSLNWPVWIGRSRLVANRVTFHDGGPALDLVTVDTDTGTVHGYASGYSFPAAVSAAWASGG